MWWLRSYPLFYWQYPQNFLSTFILSARLPGGAYLGGAFGIVAFIISMITLSHLKVMESTILLLTGQLTAGILFDAFMFHNINLKKLLGILLVAAGIIWDNKISHIPEK